MVLNIAKHETIGGIERGVYYFNLPDYPNISMEELKIAVAFVLYEKSHNRQTEIVCDDVKIIDTIKNAVANPNSIEPFILSDTTDFVYHATGLDGARKILSTGKLLSAVRVHGKTGKELSNERKDTLWNDPADFYEYIMFCNGNDMTGDWVVLSECLPSEENLVTGNFNAGVRFYIHSKDIMRHPGNLFDGFHPTKVKDEIILSEYLFACIVPEQYKSKIDNIVLPELKSKVYYLPQKGLHISDWNKRVYDFLEKL